MSESNDSGNNASNNSTSSNDHAYVARAFRRPYPLSFKRTFKAITLLSEQAQSSYGNRITMPRTALIELNRKSMPYPFLFKLTNAQDQDQVTHVGVMQFDSEEGKVYLPDWIMTNLKLSDFSEVHIEKVRLEQGLFVKLQPFTSDFLDIRDPKTVLEDCLRKFACLTKGDAITINYNTKLYRLLILDLKPANAVCIIECDLTVDFEAPLDYGVEKPDYYEEAMANNSTINNSSMVVVPFTGNGNTLSATGSTNSKLLPTINNNHNNNNGRRQRLADNFNSNNSNVSSAANFKNDINNANTASRTPGISSTKSARDQDHHQQLSNSSSSSSLAVQVDCKVDNSNHKIRGIPDHNYQIGYIYFKRHFGNNNNNNKSNNNSNNNSNSNIKEGSHIKDNNNQI